MKAQLILLVTKLRSVRSDYICGTITADEFYDKVNDITDELVALSRQDDTSATASETAPDASPEARRLQLKTVFRSLVDRLNAVKVTNTFVEFIGKSQADAFTREFKAAGYRGELTTSYDSAKCVHRVSRPHADEPLPATA